VSPSSKTSRHIALRRRSVQQTRQSSPISRARCWSVSTEHYQKQTGEQSPCGRAPLDPYERGRQRSARCSDPRTMGDFSLPPDPAGRARLGACRFSAIIVLSCWTRLADESMEFSVVLPYAFRKSPYGDLKLSNHTVSSPTISVVSGLTWC
jgi:hypothetical protein